MRCAIHFLTIDKESSVAWQVARRKVVVFRGQQDFINSPPEFYLEWGESAMELCGLGNSIPT